MGFHEKVHAFLAARYYVRLTEQFGERGRRAFVHATQYYAEQRGRRMAQRAIRDGEELNLDTYLRYGEWVNSEETEAMGCANHSEILATSPDFIKRVTVCPWHTQFAEMGLAEAGDTYCRHLDNSICRGFNPYLDYQVPQSLHQSACCFHIVRGAKLGAGPWNKKQAYLRGFDYHCGHSYWAYREAVSAIFGAEGEALAKQVLADFEECYGGEMTEKLVSYQNTNFNVCD